MLGQELAASISSPSLQAVRREQAVLLADALALEKGSRRIIAKSSFCAISKD